MKPIYKPAGRAGEYGDLAINIYTGCPHRCYYCFAPSVLRKDRETFHSDVRPRTGIVEAVKRQLDKEQITGKLIHLCFTCDPYPVGYDTATTREVIKAIKAAGNHVQILTKAGDEATRDFDLLDHNDWVGITYTGYKLGELFKVCESEPYAATPAKRLSVIREAHEKGIKTWISYEPVLYANDIILMLSLNPGYIDKVKIGKLNYHSSKINWGEFGRECERLCKEYGRNYYIKHDLRKEMENDA